MDNEQEASEAARIAVAKAINDLRDERFGTVIITLRKQHGTFFEVVPAITYSNRLKATESA